MDNNEKKITKKQKIVRLVLLLALLILMGSMLILAVLNVSDGNGKIPLECAAIPG